MADSNTQLHWTDEQWNKVRQVVYEEARRARVAGNVLPLYGPLEPDTRYVSLEELREPNSAEEPEDQVPAFTVKDTDTLRLSTLQVKVYLKGAQVADPELTSAVIAFRRAANVLARLEDEIIFNGQAGENEGPKSPKGARPKSEPEPWEVSGGQETDGLLPDSASGPKGRTVAVVPGDDSLGNALVTAVSSAIGKLEEKYHLGPFACLLDQEYFNAVQKPADKSLVLPQDRILPFLGGGTLLRSSALPKNSGVVIALGGGPIDLVVGTDICVSFLQVTPDPWFVFRVYEKIVLRIKQPDAIFALAPGNASTKKAAAAKTKGASKRKAAAAKTKGASTRKAAVAKTKGASTGKAAVAKAKGRSTKKVVAARGKESSVKKAAQAQGKRASAKKVSST